MRGQIRKLILSIFFLDRAQIFTHKLGLFVEGVRYCLLFLRHKFTLGGHSLSFHFSQVLFFLLKFEFFSRGAVTHGLSIVNLALPLSLLHSLSCRLIYVIAPHHLILVKELLSLGSKGVPLHCLDSVNESDSVADASLQPSFS